MTYSEIQITFNEDLQIDSNLGFTISSIDPIILQYVVFRWVTIRSAISEVTTGTPTGTIGERTAINFVTAFNLDWNTSGIYQITQLLNVVTIKSTISYLNFSNPFSYDDWLNPVNPNDVVFVIDNFSGNIFDIDSVTFSESSSACTHIDINVTTSTQASSYSYTRDSAPIGVTTNPFTITIVRGGSISLTVNNADGDVATQVIEIPDSFNSESFNLDINTNPEGATVIVNSDLFGLNLEYSLSGATWQTSNVFTGLSSGDYTLYVKDQYGCTKTKSFFVSEFGIQNPFFYISKANSFRWAERIVWGDSANYKTDENTLSCEVDVPLAKREIQQFQSSDIETQQIKSNYKTITAQVVDESGNIINIPITKMSSNIGLKDSRDAIKYNLQNGKTGIYFTTGNIYDYDLGNDIGDHSLNGSLPEWGISGNYIKYGGAWFMIQDIIYNEDKNAEVLVIDNEYLGVEVSEIVKSIFNRQNYEVYEFTVDFVTYISQTIHLELINADPNFTDLEHHTEDINIEVRQENTVEIRYKNKINTDIVFSTGIEFKIRVLREVINGRLEGETENYKTDATTILLNSQVYETDEFEFQPMTKEFMRKTVLALIHTDVKIDGVDYVSSGLPEVEGALGETNLYIVKATMIKSNSVFNSNNSESLEFDINGEIPGLVDYGGGWVKWN